jgi:hypothetical protein
MHVVHSKEFSLDSFVWNTNMAAMAFVEFAPWGMSENALIPCNYLK